MIVNRVLVKNFRNLVECDVRLGKFTTIVGMNNAGKTNFLLAMDKVLGSRSPRAVNIDNSDFSDPVQPIIVEVTLGDLTDDDIAAFQGLSGLINPVTQTVKIHFESKWQEDEREVFSECYIVRDDLEEDEQRGANFTHNLRRHIPFGTIPAHREVEREIDPARRGGLQGVVRTFAGDFVKPIDFLSKECTALGQELGRKAKHMGADLVDEVQCAQDVLGAFVGWIAASVDTHSQIIAGDEPVRERLERFQDEWAHAQKQVASVLDGLNAPQPEVEAVSHTLDRLAGKVVVLIRRLDTRVALSGLRGIIEETDEFSAMRQELGNVIGALIPGCNIGINLFPVQDDDLIRHTLIDMGGFPLLRHGSGYQSSFVLGVRILEAIADVLQTGVGKGVRNCVLAIEEPEVHWHPHSQRHLVNGLKQLQADWADKFSLQIIVTTHSPYIVSRVAPTELVVFRLTEVGTRPTWLGADTIQRIAAELEPDDVARQSKKHRKLQKWLDAVFERYSEVFFASCVLLVEGETDEGALPILAKKLGADGAAGSCDFDRNGITAFAVGGDGQIVYAAKLLASFGGSVVCVYDRDDSHNRPLDTMPNAFPTTARNFEGEVMASMPLQKVLRALSQTLSLERGRQVLMEYLYRIGRPYTSFEDLEELAGGVESRSFSGGDLDLLVQRVKSLLSECKGFQMGRALAGQVEDEQEIPQAYREAIRRAVALAREA